jgi:short-chain fatty acids transporter
VTGDAEGGERAAPGGLAERLERTPWLGRAFGLAGFLWLALHFAARGAVTLDVVNFGYLFLGVFLHGSAERLVRAVERGVRLASGVILQFPFYAGMYGILQGSGLAGVIADAFAAVASRETLPGIVLWYSGVVNYFVPSGGSKWAIEGPYLVQATGALGAPLSGTLLAYAWGDMLTNLIQPFWALPLLKAAGLEFRHILGYAFLLCAAYGALVSAAFWLYPP